MGGGGQNGLSILIRKILIAKFLGRGKSQYNTTRKDWEGKETKSNEQFLIKYVNS